MISFNEINGKYMGENLPHSNILGIGGSPRRGGNSDFVFSAFLAANTWLKLKIP